MNNKNDVEVYINGKKYVICGYESAQYLQQVAIYINGKYADYKENDAFVFMNQDLQNVLLMLNIADDYFVAERNYKNMKLDNEKKDNTILEMKHQAMDFEEQRNKYEKEIKELQKNLEKARSEALVLEMKNQGTQEDLDEVRSKKNEYKEKVEEAKRQATESKEQLRRSKEESRQQIDGFRKKYEQEKNDLLQKFEQAKTDMKQKYSSASDNVKEQYEAKLEEEKSKQEAKFEEEKSKHESEMMEMMENYEEEKREMKKLMEDMQKKIDTLERQKRNRR